jgi:hypothetical protein
MGWRIICTECSLVRRNNRRGPLPVVAANALLLLGAWGCGAPAGQPAADNPPGRADQITPDGDDPDGLVPGYSRKLSDLVTAAEVGQTFGTDELHIPYPDTYWPFFKADEGAINGIDRTWHGSDPSPLEKLMQLTRSDAATTTAAKAWERDRHGSGFPGVQDWHGHCIGWTGAAIASAPIQHAVSAKLDDSGALIACPEGSPGCVRFDIGDINGLEAEAYFDAPGNFIGGRCDTPKPQVHTDQFGRIDRDSGCQGVNAGALLIVVGNRLKRDHLPFGIDVQSDTTTDEIWNQPAYRYTVNGLEMLSEREAANLVASGTKDGPLLHYMWNDQAKGFALVDFTLLWVSERITVTGERAGPNVKVLSGKDTTKTTHMVAVIELDGPTGDASVIGGEYLSPKGSDADRFTVAPYVFINTGVADDNSPLDAIGSFHNPYVKPSLVQKLMKLGVD